MTIKHHPDKRPAEEQRHAEAGRSSGIAASEAKRSRHLEPAGSAEHDDHHEGEGFEPGRLPENVLEEGSITFLYKPRIGVQHATDVDDVQRFFMLLEPTKVNPEAITQATRGLVTPEHLQESKRPAAKLVIVGKKRLPQPDAHERFFSFVGATGDSAEEVTRDMGGSERTTKTLGVRVQPGARVAGKGVYTLCTGASNKGRASSHRTYLVYSLELPVEPGPCQEDLQIGSQGELAISIKNPAIKGEAGVPTAGPTPELTQEQLDLFSGLRWIACTDPRLLDYEGTELLLISGHANLKDASIGGEVIGELAHARDADIQATLMQREAQGSESAPVKRAQQHNVPHHKAVREEDEEQDAAAPLKQESVPKVEAVAKNVGVGESGEAGHVVLGQQQVEELVEEVVDHMGFIPEVTPLETGEWQ